MYGVCMEVGVRVYEVGVRVYEEELGCMEVGVRVYGGRS